MQENILVYGANGAQGGAVLRALAASGYTPIAVVRDEEAGGRLTRQGVRVVYADLNDLRSLEHASQGADKVFLTLPLGLDTATVRRYGEHAVDAAQASGVKKIVFNTGTRIPDETTEVNAFEEKRHIEAYLAASGVPFVSLRPTFYYGNFLGPWTKPGIVNEGVIAYPIPTELRAAWLSWEDAARYAVAALERETLDGRCADIGGPEALAGQDVAKRFSRVLGQDIHYTMVPHDAFEQGLSRALGVETGKAITDMYRWMVGQEDSTLFIADAARLQRDFGVSPTPLEAWVTEQNWSKASL